MTIMELTATNDTAVLTLQCATLHSTALAKRWSPPRQKKKDLHLPYRGLHPSITYVPSLISKTGLHRRRNRNDHIRRRTHLRHATDRRKPSPKRPNPVVHHHARQTQQCNQYRRDPNRPRQPQLRHNRVHPGIQDETMGSSVVVDGPSTFHGIFLPFPSLIYMCVSRQVTNE